MATTSLEVLQQKANRINGRLRDAKEQELNRVARPKLRKLLGKCFVYQNTYGVSDDCKRWPLYARIVGFNEKDMTYKTVQFQESTRHHIEVEFERVYNWRGVSNLGVENGWQPITVAQFNAAKKRLLGRIVSILETDAAEN